MGARTILWLSLSGQACFRMLLVIRELSTSQFPLLGNTIWGKMYKNNRRSTCNQPHPLYRLLAWLWYLRTSLGKKLQALKAEHTWVDRSIHTASPIRTPWVLLRSAALNCTESYMKKIKSRKHKKMEKKMPAENKLKFWREPSCSPTILPNYSQYCRINKISNKIRIVPLHVLNFRKEDPCSTSCGGRWFVLEISGRACFLCLCLDWQLTRDLEAEFLFNAPLELKWLRCFGKISNYLRLNQDKHHLGLSSKCCCCHWENLGVVWLGDKHF